VDEQYERRHAAVMALVRAALDRFAEGEGQPRFADRLDNQRWRRFAQEDFIGLERDAWIMPDTLPYHGWLDKFPEMASVRATYAEDPILSARVDTLMGTTFMRTGTNFYWILAKHVIEPLVKETRSYEFDDVTFNGIYANFERQFRAETLHMVEYRPLNGFVSNDDAVLLPDGLVLRQMTDHQISAAIGVQAVPRLHGGNRVNGARVSRFDQRALVRVTEYPVVTGHGDAVAADEPPFPLLDDPAERIVTALRLTCGGSVVATRSLFGQADDEFPFVAGESTILSTFATADNDRPTYLLTDALQELRGTYLMLALPEVKGDRSLQVAIRRLVYAGSRTLDADRLIDLMIAAEALFIKRAGQIQTRTKRNKIAAGASAMLANDPILNTDKQHIETFVTTAYKARNAEIHGDGELYKPLHLLSGLPTDSLTQVLNDLERIMRRAILTTLRQHANDALSATSTGS
jgi:hypothetical protein